MPTITPEQLYWIEQCDPVSAVDLLDLGLPDEGTLEVSTTEDLLELFSGIDAEGRAL